MIKRLLTTFLFLLLSTPVAWAEGPYYFKNGGNDSLDGLSDATAWANPSVKLDGQSFNDGTDFYFKQGDTFTVSNDIDINHSGVDGANRSIIGCYEGDGDFDCSGAKPIIEQTSSTQAVFKLNNNNSYLTFKDLDIRNTSGSWQDTGNAGIATLDDGSGGNGDAGYIIVNNCNFYHLGHYSIGLARIGNYNIITNNTFTTVGNAIYFIDEYTNGGSSYNYIADNTCTDIVGYKSVDGHCVALQRTAYTIVEKNNSTDANAGAFVLWTGNGSGSAYARSNIFADNTSYGTYGGAIYIGGNENGDSYHNLVYKNIVTNTAQGQSRDAIRASNFLPDSKGNRIFDNTIYNAYSGGMGVLHNTDYTYWKNNIVVINNLSNYLFHFQTDGSSGHNLVIDYNLYWTLAGDPSATTLWIDTNSTAYNWSDWTTSRSNDVNSPSPANPYFNDPGNNDFSLTTNSTSAIDQGGWLTYVSQAGTATTELYVADTYWFHGDFGLVDEDGNAIAGQPITLYDTTNGLQHTTINEVTITHGTPGHFTLDDAVTYIYSVGHETDPTQTTQVSVGTIYGSAPDIGAEETAGEADPTGTLSTGFQGSNVTESQIVAGSVGGADITIIITLSGTTWDATLGGDNAVSTAFIQGFDSAQSETHGWNNDIRDVLTFAAINRDSDTQATLTVPATATYSITANEYITVTIPASCVDSASEIVVDGTLTISNETPSVAGVGLSYSSTGRTYTQDSTGVHITID